MLKDRTYRLPAVLLILTAVFSASLISVAMAEEEEYAFDTITYSSGGSNLFISGDLYGPFPAGMTVEFEGAVSGTVNVLIDGSFSLSTSPATGGVTATLWEDGEEMDIYEFDID